MSDYTRSLALLACCISGLVAAPAAAQCIDTLSLARSSPAATSAGGYVLFAGGNDSSMNTASGVVDLFEPATGTWSVAQLSVERDEVAAASVSGLALFAGGGFYIQTFQVIVNDRVDIFDSQTAAWSQASLSQARRGIASAISGTRAYFAGGIASPTPPFTFSDVVDVFDGATGTWSALTLSTPRAYMTAAAAGGRVLFAGGHDGASEVATVDIYDTFSGTWSTSQLSAPRRNIASTSVGSLVLFAGGTVFDGTNFVPSDIVDVYDTNTGLWTVEQLSIPRSDIAAASIGGRVLFAGGLDANEQATTVIDVRDTGYWSTLELSDARYSLGAVSDVSGIYFGGGAYPNTSVKSDAVERFLPLFPRAFCFGDGSGTACPCGNGGAAGSGCANSTGVGARLAGEGCHSVSDDGLILRVEGLPPGQPALLFAADNAVAMGQGVIFGDGLRCAGGSVQRIAIRAGSATGQASWGPDLVSSEGWIAGDLFRLQAWYRDPSGPCSSGFNLSNGVEVLIAP